METAEIINGEQSYLVQTYARPEIVFDRGEGVYLYDSEGQRYLDFMSGIAVTALGHGDPAWVEAVCSQAQRLAHVSNLYHTQPHVALARRLVENSFADRVFFCNSGSEANETALKFARKYARTHHGEGKSGIVAFEGGFHGRTMGALSVTAREKYQAPFAPLVPGVTFAPFNDPEAAAAAIGPDACAVIVEPLQGEGGVHPTTPEFLRAVREACDAHDALLIFDEVQCGLGRSGTLWAYEAYGVEPDLMTVAKPLAGGLPIGAALVRQRVADVMAVGDHGSTFAAGPVVCHAATVVFDRVADPDFLAAVRDKGRLLLAGLNRLPGGHVQEVRGRGLLLGVELDRPVKPVVAAARARGLLVINAGETVLRLAPPLVIADEQIEQGLALLAEALEAA